MAERGSRRASLGAVPPKDASCTHAMNERTNERTNERSERIRIHERAGSWAVVRCPPFSPPPPFPRHTVSPVFPFCFPEHLPSVPQNLLSERHTPQPNRRACLYYLPHPVSVRHRRFVASLSPSHSSPTIPNYLFPSTPSHLTALHLVPRYSNPQQFLSLHTQNCCISLIVWASRFVQHYVASLIRILFLYSYTTHTPDPAEGWLFCNRQQLDLMTAMRNESNNPKGFMHSWVARLS